MKYCTTRTAVFSCKIIQFSNSYKGWIYWPALVVRWGDCGHKTQKTALSVFKMYISYKFSQHNKSPEPHFWPQSPVISPGRASREVEPRQNKSETINNTTSRQGHTAVSVTTHHTAAPHQTDNWEEKYFWDTRGEWGQLLMIQSEMVIGLLYSNQDTSGPDCSWSWQDLKGYWLGHT